MTEPVTLEFVLRVLRQSMETFDGYHEIWWRTDEPEYAPITFFARCNDLFYWACADCEDVTPDNIGEMESATADVLAVLAEDSSKAYLYATALFCCRIRKMRPQGAWYRGVDPRVVPLFDDAGPERDAAEPGNTPRVKDSPPQSKKPEKKRGTTMKYLISLGALAVIDLTLICWFWGLAPAFLSAAMMYVAFAAGQIRGWERRP